MKKPKILFYDCETTPLKAWIWRPGYNMNVGHDQICAGERTRIICISYKFLNKPVKTLVWDKKQNDDKLIDDFTKVLADADVVIAHNGDRFDMKHVNTQRLLAGQDPIAWPISEDTLKGVKKHFNFASNRLDYLAKTLLGAGKDKMSFQDWIDIKEYKCPKALKKMIKYCERDVKLLEGVWKKIAPFLEPKVSRAAIMGKSKLCCPSCGSGQTIFNGTRRTKFKVYNRMLCGSCAHNFKGPIIDA